METIIPQQKQNLDQTSQSESESGSSASDSSTSGSESSSSSDSELPLLRPIFLKKKQKKPLVSIHDLNRAVLAKAEHLQQIEAKSVEKMPFDGVDDSDDIDPEQEYLQWKLRESSRRKRDADKIAQAELAKEDAMRRKKGIFRDYSTQISGDSIGEKNEETEAYKSVKLGAFFSEDLDYKYLKRDYKNVEDKEDHSRPTKYKKA